MSDLLALAAAGEFDLPEFVDRIAGLFRNCQHINLRAAQLTRQTEQRIEGIRWNIFKGIAEIGEALLKVQEDPRRPGGFEEWFANHQTRLGFKLRHARDCQAAARSVRAHGLEEAYRLALIKAEQQRSAAPALRIPLSVEGIPEERARELFEKIRPIYEALRSRVGELPEAGGE